MSEGEAPSADISDLWAIYQTTKSQLVAVQVEKAAVLASLASAGAVGATNGDYASFSRGGPGGNESYAGPALLERFKTLCETEKLLTDTLKEQRRLAIAASPGIQRRRVNRGWFGRWGW